MDLAASGPGLLYDFIACSYIAGPMLLDRRAVLACPHRSQAAASLLPAAPQSHLGGVDVASQQALQG